MSDHSETMRFSRELLDGVEWFTVTWLDGACRTERRTDHFPTEARFKAWLVDQQAYSPDEADDAIEQVRNYRR